MTRYYLSISTWAGLAPGATHYYGRIVSDFKAVVPKPKVGLDFDCEEYDVERAKAYKGWKTRFDSEEQVIAAAIKTFLRLKLKGLLYIGSCGTAQPKRVLLAPKSLLEKAKQENRLWRQMEKVYARGGWEKREKEMQTICDQWEALWK
jgi:hypothetical protein